METIFSSGVFIPLWILGAPLLGALILLVVNPRPGHRGARDRSEVPMARRL